MAAPTIASLPAAPDRGTPGTTFSPVAATFVAALPDLVTEINAFGAWLNSNVLVSYEWGAGSAAAPSVHPTGDTNTGIYFPAADQVAAATGGTRRWLLSTTALQVDVPITGTAVQSSATDTTAGKLMTVGAFGLGADRAVYVTDLNAISAVGLYRIGSGDAPTGNAPLSASSFYVYHTAYDSNSAAQIAVRASSVHGVYVRTKSAGTWTPWTEIYHRSNILGTVSQSGGVPTGAIIERGSNANGEYVRFADGTQICTFTLSSSASAAVTWTFPASFSAAPRVTTTCRAAALRVGTTGSFSTTSVDLNGFDLAGNRQANPYDLFAIGKWF